MGNMAEEFTVYIEQSRSLLESQRANFERERSSFANERKLWEMERSMLKARITDLEAAQIKDGLRVNDYKLDGSSPASQFRPDFALRERGSIPQTQGGSNGQHHVWEGPITADSKPTRVFPSEGDRLFNQPTTTGEENGFGRVPSLDAALSPNSRAFNRCVEASLPVPIEKLDSELDGITLKSTALAPVLVAKVIISSESSPSPVSPRHPELPRLESERRLPLKLKLSELGPPEENLIREAGHTPMAVIGTDPGTESGTATQQSQQSPSIPSYTEDPRAPVHTTQPTESSHSYFPDVIDDPGLKGPLTLPTDAKQDDDFLLELDMRLLQEAKRVVSGPSTEQTDGPDKEGDGEPDIELKLKGTKNFGSAFGAANCGAV